MFWDCRRKTGFSVPRNDQRAFSPRFRLAAAFSTRRRSSSFSLLISARFLAMCSLSDKAMFLRFDCGTGDGVACFWKSFVQGFLVLGTH